jgi:transcriptional regulator with XRE-family HTH domain
MRAVTRDTARYRSVRLALKQARQDAKLTQSTVAQRLRKPQSFVAKYEQGERRIDVVEFIDIAKALGLEPLTFLRTILFRDIVHK